MTQRVLMVDDEPRILDAMRRSLHGRFAVETATSGADGLAMVEKALADGDPYPVVVSDMMMPGMNGAEFLGRAHELHPDAVQMILSGQADLTSTIAAVNTAGLFRFLTKPCETGQLTRALEDALRQHRLVVSERELIEHTLDGAIEVLTELLGIASPVAFGRTTRVRLLVDAVCETVAVDDLWELRLASMLGQIGCVAVPEPVLQRQAFGHQLDDADTRLYQGHRDLARALLTRIPRLERVAAWVGAQPLSLDEVSPRPAHPLVPQPTTPEQAAAARQPVPGETVFRVVTAFLTGIDEGGTRQAVALRLVTTGGFPRHVVDAVLAAADRLYADGTPREVLVRQLRPGMVLTEDVVTAAGMTLVRQGEVVSGSVALRLLNFHESVGLVEPLHVVVRD